MRGYFARELKQTYAFAGFALLVLAALLATSFWLFEKNRQTSDKLLEAREKRGALFRLLISLQDAETGQRGYLLTGDPAYLAPYEAATTTVNERLTAIGSVFKNEPQQLSEIEAMVRNKLAELASTIELRKTGRTDEALGLVKSGRGREIMDELRERLGEMLDTIDATLGDSVLEQKKIANETRTFTIFSALLILAAALGAISTIVRYTQALLQARTDLEHANAGLEQRVAERTADLQRANDEIQRFAYIVSHDLRSPLVNIMGFTGELETSIASLKPVSASPGLAALDGGPVAKQAIDKDIPEAVDFIRRSTAKMDGLIKAILRLSREGQRVLIPERVDLAELFRSLEAGVQHRLGELGGKIEIGKPLGAISCDRLALDQIFGNLIDNAIKYRRPSVPPFIVIREEAGRRGTIVISVSDNGRGIAPEDHERVFDLFRRAGKQDQPGEGIGLAHVRALVRRLGGDILMTSEVGSGTTFRVVLNERL